MINVEYCFGCTACQEVCPASAVEMVRSSEGFYVPHVDSVKCVGCGQCDRVCPMLHRENVGNEFKSAYLFMNRSELNRNLSSSGGVIQAISEMVIAQDQGIVYGCRMDGDCTAVYASAQKIDDVYPLLGSKYVQAKMGGGFQNVSQNLQEGRKVLFVGTSCYIAGLLNYLREVGGENITSNLFTVDVMCHGVPSDGIWKSYLTEYFGKENIKYVQFRYKNLGWWSYGLRMQFEHSDYMAAERLKDPYMYCFLKNVSINQTCYNCPFRTRKHNSDLYIGDAWNINKIRSNMDDNRGCTSVLANTEKGENVMKALKEMGHNVFEISVEEALFERRDLLEEKNVPETRSLFYKEYKENGFKAAYEKINAMMENIIK